MVISLSVISMWAIIPQPFLGETEVDIRLDKAVEIDIVVEIGVVTTLCIWELQPLID